MAKRIYIDRMGDAIYEEKWKTLRANPNYVQLGHYINDKWEVMAVWTGECDENDYVYKPYKLVIFMRLDGIRLTMSKPHEDTAIFASEKELSDHYEDFLVRHCGCEWIGSHFVEKGNTLKPATPAMPVRGQFAIGKMTEEQLEDAATW